MKRWSLSPTIIVFALFVLASFLLRLTFLRTTPGFFSHDEIHYVTEAQSIALSGSDLKQEWRPWYFRPTNGLYAELPSTVMAVGSFLSDDPFVKARIVYVILGTLLPLILGGIAWKLTGQKNTFYTTAVVGLVNPWLFQFSRLSFDALPSLFFYSLGILMVITLPKNWRMLSIVAFIIGFFQYQGLKIIFPFVVAFPVLYVIWLEWTGQSVTETWNKKSEVLKTFLDLLVLLILSGLIFIWYLTVLSSQTAAVRVNDILFFNETYLAQRVNDQRRISLESPLHTLFINKITIIALEFGRKYFDTFSFTNLFMFGESVRNPFSVWSRGMFHPFDVVLFFAGIVGLSQWIKSRKAAALLVGFFIIAPLPVAINSVDTWIMFRGAWIVVTGIIVMGLGLWYLMTKLPKGVLVIAALIYCVGVASFGYEYFYRYPIYSVKNSPFGDRVMASYIQRLGKEQKVTVLTDASLLVFENYLAYSNLITRENLPTIQQAVKNEKYVLGNAEFVTKCFDTKNISPNQVVINSAVNVSCDNKTVTPSDLASIDIPSLVDNGAIFRVYNDPLCSEHVTSGFLHLTDRKYLDVEKLSDKEFCANLFTQSKVN